MAKLLLICIIIFQNFGFDYQPNNNENIISTKIILNEPSLSRIPRYSKAILRQKV